MTRRQARRYNKPMYAQCPHCETVFRLRAEQLRVARGQVRCSRCNNIFDALHTLREDVPDPQDTANTAATRVRERDPDTVADLFEAQSLTQNEEMALGEQDDPTLRLHQDGPPAEIEAESAQPVSLDFPAEERQVAEKNSSPRGWLAACLLLGLVLLLQIAHANRNNLATVDWLAGPVRSAYALFDFDLPPPQALAHLSILDVEIISHPTLPGVLQLNAVLANQAGFAQAWPVLKVRLEDRWGGAVGQRYFRPLDYLGQTPDTLLPAHENTVISLSLVDPGKSAVGYFVDTCFSGKTGWQCRANIN